MKKLIPVIFVSILCFAFRSAPNTTYKCMIQMTNYSGEGAYIAISLLDSKGDYVKTLQVIGDDREWYSDITAWWDFQKKVTEDLDALSGATISGGERHISTLRIANDMIDRGYSIRFESVVEDQAYHKSDVEFELTSASVKSKVQGSGFIRYIRMMPQAN